MSSPRSKIRKLLAACRRRWRTSPRLRDHTKLWTGFAFLVVLPAVFAIVYVDREIFGGPLTGRWQEQHTRLPEHGPYLGEDWTGAKEFCPLARDDVSTSAYWIDGPRIITPGLGRPVDADIWTNLSSVLGGYSCTARYRVAVTVERWANDPYGMPASGRAPSFSNPRLVERLAPPPERDGYWSALPGECVVIPIDPSVEEQTDRILVRLPAERRIILDLHPHLTIWTKGLELTWRVAKPKVRRLPDPPPSYMESLASPTGFAETLTAGIHEFEIVRTGLPASPAPGPAYVYGFRVTWGQRVMVRGCPNDLDAYPAIGMLEPSSSSFPVERHSQPGDSSP